MQMLNNRRSKIRLHSYGPYRETLLSYVIAFVRAMGAEYNGESLAFMKNG